ncbi:MAG TPA: carboxypeptidase-like regulatory domain-containing protein, partial [Hanamia sp.]|nr:carboxypeptidase-like regulatory domain-containing protein [Hanamia sp.]
MKYIIGLVGILLSALSVNAQELSTNKIISGKVISASNNLPVEGATLILSQQGTVVTTNRSGAFSIPLSFSNDVLTVSHIGFRSKKISISQNTASPFIITLQDTSIKLNEVVVSTGYQNIPKERATGSFVTVNMNQFNNEVASDVISKLEGITSGLVFFKGVPNRPDEINIRGQSTLFSNTQPLIVVDNFPYDGDINTINPNDVESITVLKDAAAASIWGVRAGNGVIVITTKKGKFNKPLQVSFNSNITVGEKPDLFYDSRFINSSDFIDLESFLFSKGFYDNDFSAASQPPL